MREKRKEVLQAEETSYFYTTLTKEGFMDHFKKEEGREVVYSSKSSGSFPFHCYRLPQ